MHQLEVSKIFIFIVSFFCFASIASASSYTPTTNLFESSYSNNLIDMAQSQIKNFVYKDYVIIQSDNNYYLICGEVTEITDGYINFKDTTIIQAYRPNGGYYSYEYSTFNEAYTTVYTNYYVISNTQSKRAISSPRVGEYTFNKNVTLLCTFILGLVFATFLIKERRY